MARTLSDRVAEAASRSFVGRRRELDLVEAAIAGREPSHLVVFVHGPGGIGKTRLVRTALARAGDEVRVLALDCPDIEPTPEGFLDHLATAIGGTIPERTPGELAAAMGAAGRRLVLALDGYESFGLMDSWLRQTFLPSLPDNVVTILSGRDAPRHGWLTTPGWSGVVATIDLRPLPHSDAMLMLRGHGLSELEAARTNRFTCGHPLAIELAAAAVTADPGLAEPTGRPPSVVTLQLLDAVCAALEPETREALEAASVVRRVNEPVLRVLLPEASARDAFMRLAGLPFVDRRPHGLLVHDVVRDAVARELAERDPEVFARLRVAAAHHFQALATRAGGERLWEVTADLVFMLRNPYVRECCFPTAASDVSIERAVAADDAAIRTIVRAHEPPEAAALTLRWWQRHADAFRVARSSASEVAAFHCVIDLAEADPALLADDPVAGRWIDHMQRMPPPQGGRVLLLRRWLGEETGELPSPAIAAAWLSLKQIYMEMSPSLTRLYSVIVDVGQLAPIFMPLGFGACGDPVPMGGRDYVPVSLDFGPGSVDGWLAGLIETELAEPAGPRAAPSGEGPLAALSEREREVLLLLADGASNRRIGDRLVISDRTAGRHVANIFSKLGVHSRAEAARIAAECGLTAAEA